MREVDPATTNGAATQVAIPATISSPLGLEVDAKKIVPGVTARINPSND
jgi:hypothetical protein